ncbi:MAG: hypothetical protein IJR56_07165 [Bacteroidaceae bacterium]|nr:hypothetical protein [Bacteroidaceae bacterium]
MAKIFYELKQNNVDGSVSKGKWFAYVKAIETLNTRKLAQHIAEHGSVYTPDVVFGVLEKFRSCLVEMLLESKKVKIDGLGTFYCTIENVKGGAETKEKFNVQANLGALHIRFMPEQEQEMNISSREFIKKAEFINILSLINGTNSDADTPLDTGDNTGDDSGEGGNTGGDDNGGGTDDQGNGDGGIG